MPKLKQDMRAILTTNWKIWIPFQFLNFNFVPQQLQVGVNTSFTNNSAQCFCPLLHVHVHHLQHAHGYCTATGGGWQDL